MQNIRKVDKLNIHTHTHTKDTKLGKCGGGIDLGGVEGEG